MNIVGRGGKINIERVLLHNHHEISYKPSAYSLFALPHDGVNNLEDVLAIIEK